MRLPAAQIKGQLAVDTEMYLRQAQCTGEAMLLSDAMRAAFAGRPTPLGRSSSTPRAPAGRARRPAPHPLRSTCPEPR